MEVSNINSKINSNINSLKKQNKVYFRSCFLHLLHLHCFDSKILPLVNYKELNYETYGR